MGGKGSGRWGVKPIEKISNSADITNGNNNDVKKTVVSTYENQEHIAYQIIPSRDGNYVIRTLVVIDGIVHEVSDSDSNLLYIQMDKLKDIIEGKFI